MPYRKFAMSMFAMAACTTNQSGNVSSSKTGDTSHPAERRSPVDGLRAACGSGALTDYGATALKRQPYLQQVTTSDAIVGWVSTQLAGARVEVTNPQNMAVEVTPAIVEDVAFPVPDESQLWGPVNELTASNVYCYSLADDGGALTEPTGFKTAPAMDDPAPVRFLAFGDSGGGGSDQYTLMNQMYTVPYDLMIHTGDVAYNDGTLGQYEANVFGVYADLFRNIPFFPSAGNHDYHTASAAAFRDVFNLPGANGEKWYSFDWGRVHFVALDTESDYATQAKWLDNDLAATDRTWKIVYMHRPPYSSGYHGSDTRLRDVLAPVLARHGVQLVLAGHDHDYERIAPQNGTTYVVTGGGGRGTYTVGSSSFTVLADDVIHFVYGEVTADELTLHAIDATGREFDSVIIPRA